MKRFGQLIFSLLLLATIPVAAHAQAWSGIINSGRAVSWTTAGVSGGVPSGSWTQCVTSQCATVTSAGSGATVAQINAAIASAPANTYVLLAPGTYTFTSPIVVSDYASEKNNVALRGSGANSTLIIYNGPSGGGCFGSAISIEGDCSYTNGGEENVCDVTGGLSQGSTSITLANCGATAPGFGNLGNLKVGSMLILDQLDELTDTGKIWNCAQQGTCAGTIQGGEDRANGPCGSSFQGAWSSGTSYSTGQSVSTGSYSSGAYTYIATQNSTGQSPNQTTNTYWAICQRSQQQGVTVTNISGSTITFTPGLYMPNWNSTQQPQAWFPNNTITHVGLENLSIDTTNATSIVSTINMLGCNGCWVKGVRSIKANRSHVRFLQTVHSVFRDSYLYANQGSSSQSYGMEIMGGWDNLIENNITQQITDSDPSCTGPCSGNVLAYNYDIDNVFGTVSYIVPPFFQHASGDSFNLWEGNTGPGYSTDDIHGTHHFETVYRDFLMGWQPVCYAGTACISQTVPFYLFAGSRYLNLIGNVLGQPGYHTTYQCSALTSNTYCSASYQVGGKDVMIYQLGFYGLGYTPATGYCLQPACTSHGTYDPQTTSYLMRWANWDVVNGATQYNSSEVPTGIASYSNAVPTSICTASSPTCPGSFYNNVTTAHSSCGTGIGFWMNPTSGTCPPYPPIGPDVSSGNIVICSGGTYAGAAVPSAFSSRCAGGSTATAWGGHVNASPAMICYFQMGGLPDGTGGVLSFSPAACYANDTGVVGSGLQPAAPTNLTATVD